MSLTRFQQIEGRGFENLAPLDSKTHRDTARDIEHHLRLLKVDFEGRTIPISVVPTILERDEVAGVSEDGALVKGALEALIQAFLREYREGRQDGPLLRMFGHYSKWWGLIAEERRTLPHINLMRYDCVRTSRGRWSVLENNTACPGGVIHCAKIRTAWLMTRLGIGARRGLDLETYPIDLDTGFLEFLFETARAVSGAESPGVAICSYRGTYSNELKTLESQFDAMKARGLIDPRAELIVCDARDVRCEGAEATVAGRSVSLIYNKLDPLQIDPDSDELQGWIRASRSGHVEFLNSFAAMYLTEAKRSLAVLSDASFWPTLGLDGATISAIQRLVPFTRALGTSRSDEQNQQSDEFLGWCRPEFVAKADALTRGQGVHLGAALTPAQWSAALEETRRHNGVVQRSVEIPSRANLWPSSHDPDLLIPYRDYFGIDLFYFGNSFAGPVSRSHSQKIFNIGSGGKESPTLVVRGETHAG